MRLSILLLGISLAAASIAAPLHAQHRPFESEVGAAEAPATRALGARVRSDTRPALRTAATVLASASGFAYAQSRQDAASEELWVPFAAGMAASTIAGWALSDASTAKVIAGSVIGILPASALASFLHGILPEEERGQIPMFAFSVPQGLVTSAFAQRRPR